MLYPDGSIEIPAKGDLPAIILAVTELESSDPALRAFGFLTWNSLDAGLSFANLPAWLYVCALRIQRLLMVRFAERLLLNRMCTDTRFEYGDPDSMRIDPAERMGVDRNGEPIKTASILVAHKSTKEKFLFVEVV
jgi:hypothetical protein